MFFQQLFSHQDIFSPNTYSIRIKQQTFTYECIECLSSAENSILSRSFICLGRHKKGVVAYFGNLLDCQFRYLSHIINIQQQLARREIMWKQLKRVAKVLYEAQNKSKSPSTKLLSAIYIPCLGYITLTYLNLGFHQETPSQQTLQYLDLKAQDSSSQIQNQLNFDKNNKPAS